MVISSSQNSLKQLIRTSMHNTFLAFGKNIKEKNVIWLFLQIYLFIYLYLLPSSGTHAIKKGLCERDPHHQCLWHTSGKELFQHIMGMSHKTAIYQKILGRKIW